MESCRKPWVSLLFLLLPSLQSCTTTSNTQSCNRDVDGSIYNYGANALNESTYIPLQLNALHDELNHLGFTILGFPCNQFGQQEPGANNEILPALKYVRPGNGFVPNFQLFEKGDVNGESEQSLFTFLKNACPPVGDSFGNPTNRLFWEPLKVSDIKWNFEKFLIGRDGKPLKRWFPRVNVSEVRSDIIRLIRQQYTKH
ncbi:hypothetical protein NFI96_034015 [Prochilodus magdalenae]|nr:hypothetical protein NFI96_034015 [Prochilodus magdalenae]